MTHVQSGLFHHLPSIFLSPENLTKTILPPPLPRKYVASIVCTTISSLAICVSGVSVTLILCPLHFLTSRSKSQQNPSPAHPAPSFPGRWLPHVSKCNVWPHEKLQFAPPLSPQCPCNTILRYVLYRICDASLRSTS